MRVKSRMGLKLLRSFPFDYDSPYLLVVVVMPVTHVTTTVQKFIVVGMPGTHVTTTVQIFIVVG